jgi:hypothetical protein
MKRAINSFLTPPPASTPKNRIIKSPGQSATKPAEPSDTASASKDAANAQQKPMTTSARNEDFNKRRAEQAEKDKKASEDQQANADKQKNCERARSYQKVLESGQRVATTDKTVSATTVRCTAGKRSGGCKKHWLAVINFSNDRYTANFCCFSARRRLASIGSASKGR